MVAAIPVRFKRVAAAFEEVAKMRGGCGSGSSSSGSEHSPAVEGESLRDLSDLVNSFLEKGNYGNFEGDENDDGVDLVVGDFDDLDDHEKLYYDQEKDLVERFLGFEDGDEFRREICLEVEEGLRFVGDSSSPEFKRRLMTWLRERGHDAGLCKSKWEKNGRLPSGQYEYIDINKDGARYIIEVSLAAEFDIARPTNTYISLLKKLPLIFVSKVEVLKQVVRLMCNGIKKSMKRVDRHVPPWRRHEYVQAKWFGSYKRTTNEVSTKSWSGSFVDSGKKRSTTNEVSTKSWSGSFVVSGKKRSVGFVPMSDKSFYCREDFVNKNIEFKVGNLAMAINGCDMIT